MCLFSGGAFVSQQANRSVAVDCPTVDKDKRVPDRLKRRFPFFLYLGAVSTQRREKRRRQEPATNYVAKNGREGVGKETLVSKQSSARKTAEFSQPTASVPFHKRQPKPLLLLKHTASSWPRPRQHFQQPSYVSSFLSWKTRTSTPYCISRQYSAAEDPKETP